VLKITAVVITVPGQETVRIGPFIAPTNAARYAERLRAVAARRRPAATVTTERAGESQPHIAPRVPTDPWSLAHEIAAEENEFAGEPPFPDLHTRLGVQIGEDAAEKLWERATGWTEPADSNTSRLDQLAESAETWRHNRDQATNALRHIAVELWRAGMRNKNDIQAITGLSRTTIYEALDDAIGLDASRITTATAKLAESTAAVDKATREFADKARLRG
jgi:hypothetical protein